MSKVSGNWADLKILPGRLTKLVVEHKAKIIGRDKYGRRLYEMDADDQKAEVLKGQVVHR